MPKRTRHAVTRMKSLRDRGEAASERLLAVGSVFELFPSTRRFDFADDPFEADAEAMRSDWEAVGDDLLTAAEMHSAQQ